ncbi:NAD(P)-dependent oxidoreductase [Viridibacterium curvum]|uniref:NAD(P)-dependent oxidoreductase n=1 Tax=Viridibacterium curvum TaxID=1101404 RepID=A0ABP9R8E1_9RHOO
MSAPSPPACRRIVLTGAAGRLGRMLRAPLRALCEELVLSDIAPLSEPPCGNESLQPCDLADHAAVVELLRGAQMVVHMGGMAHERDFASLLPANIVGQYNLYDAALANGMRRVVLASSNHVTGFYRMDEMVSPSMPMRPDSLYAVSKGYGELLASYFHDRHGLESVCLRIGACRERPSDLRSLAAWLSPADFAELVRCALLAEAPGCAVVYGVSDNPGRWWHDDDAARIGYLPRDSSARWVADLGADLAAVPAPAPTAQSGLQGGLRVMLNDYRDPATFDVAPRPCKS